MKKERGNQKSSAESLLHRLEDLRNGRDEMNLCELPFAALSERAGNRRMLQFEVEDYDRTSGQTICRSLIVKGDPEFGLPTEKDEEIYLGLLKYSSDFNGFSSPEIFLVRSALFDLMGWPKSDWAYRRLALGMQRLVGVRLSYQNLWRDNRDKQWRDQGAFSILESFRFRDSRLITGNASFSEHSSVFRWSSVLFDSFDSGYLKRVDYGLTRQLSPTARRLYRYLDKHFHPPRRRVISMDLSRLAYQHIGISKGIALDKVRKRYIAPAAEELVQAGYLVDCDLEQRFQSLKRGIWSAHFECTTAANLAIVPVAASSRIVSALCQRGISANLAVQIEQRHSREAVVTAIKALDEQRRTGTIIRSPDRWISKAIVAGFQPSGELEKSRLRPERRIFRARRASKS